MCYKHPISWFILHKTSAHHWSFVNFWPSNKLADLVGSLYVRRQGDGVRSVSSANPLSPLPSVHNKIPPARQEQTTCNCWCSRRQTDKQCVATSAGRRIAEGRASASMQLTIMQLLAYKDWIKMDMRRGPERPQTEELQKSTKRIHRITERTTKWWTGVLRKTMKKCQNIRLDDAIPLIPEDMALFLRSWWSLNWSRNSTV